MGSDHPNDRWTRRGFVVGGDTGPKWNFESIVEQSCELLSEVLRLQNS